MVSLSRWTSAPGYKAPDTRRRLKLALRHLEALGAHLSFRLSLIPPCRALLEEAALQELPSCLALEVSCALQILV